MSKVHDINCGLKAFRKDVIQNLNLYGGLQRFFPVFVMKSGYKVMEIDVPHKERFSEKSKFNWMRIPRSFFNLAVVVLLSEYYRRPLHLFGAIGLLCSLVGFTVCAFLSILKIFTGTIQGHNTLLLLGVMTIIFGFQWISTGLLGEIIAGLDEEIELGAGDLDVMFITGDQLDVETLAAEQVMLNLPMRVLCQPDCPGLCARCGANKNQKGSCRCEPERRCRFVLHHRGQRVGRERGQCRHRRRQRRRDSACL